MASRSGTRAYAAAVVVVLLLLGIGLAGVGCGASEAELLSTLKTTADLETRHDAAKDLSRMHSLQATQDLLTAAGSSAEAEAGTVALRDEYIALLASRPEEGFSEEDEKAFLTIVDCLALIGDDVSAEALGALCAASDAYPLDVKLHAVEALGLLGGETAAMQLVRTVTAPGGTEHVAPVQSAAVGALTARADAVSLLIEARIEESGDQELCATIDGLLEGLGAPAAEALVGRMQEEEWAVDILLRMGRVAVPSLVGAMGDSEAAVRYGGLDLLLRLYEDDAAAYEADVVDAGMVPLLIEARSRADYEPLRNATIDEVLVQIGQPAISALVDQLGKLGWADPVLAQAGTAAAPQLVEALNGTDIAASHRALSALLYFYATDSAAAKPFLAVPELIPVFIDTYVDYPYGDERDSTIEAVLVEIGTPALSDLITRSAALLDDEGECSDYEHGWSYSDLIGFYDDAQVVDTLMSTLQGASSDTRMSLFFLVIRLAVPGSEERLADYLLKSGTKAMGVVCLNCGSEVLEDAAEKWGNAHGYYVVTTEGEASPYSGLWGSY